MVLVSEASGTVKEMMSVRRGRIEPDIAAMVDAALTRACAALSKEDMVESICAVVKALFGHANDHDDVSKSSSSNPSVSASVAAVDLTVCSKAHQARTFSFNPSHSDDGARMIVSRMVGAKRLG